MRKLYASLVLASSMTLGVLGLTQVEQADMLTGVSVTDRYVSGQLEPRLDEIGTNKQTGAKMPQWRLTVENGVKRLCRNVNVVRGTSTAKCK